MPDSEPKALIGIDTGGTFTDAVIVDADGVRHFKIPSNREDPAAPVIEAARRVMDLQPLERVVHGATVATNAVLERRGAKIALVTTAGFEDLLAIGRQTRRELYNLRGAADTPLVEPDCCLGIEERTAADGTILRKPGLLHTTRLVKQLNQLEVDVVAICFLHSYANPENERAVGEHLRAAGFDVTLSSDVSPEYREYERCSTTAINAFLRPVLDRYYARLEAALPPGRLRIMQSSGGSISSAAARALPVLTVLSGPAGGAVAAQELGKLAGFEKLITLDMGGTSTDVAVIGAELPLTTEGGIDNMPIRLPMIDIVTVGAGGGSIAWLDAGGALRVGPRSAGAQPGPVCYGVGEELTVTDAHLFLGQIPADELLGGVIAPDRHRTFQFFEKTAAACGMDPTALAEGIIRVAEATMERALRVVSVQRGHDPRDFALFAFGGAGGLHACRLAEALLMHTVIVPNRAGVISALGALMADVVKDYSRTQFLSREQLGASHLDTLFSALEERAREDLESEGIAREMMVLERAVAMRYIGQSYELRLPCGPDLIDRFHALHEQRYGYADPRRDVEGVNLILRAIGRNPRPTLDRQPEQVHQPAGKEVTMMAAGKPVAARFHRRSELKAGARFTGPALVFGADSTALVPPGWSCRVDPWLNLILEKERGR